MLLAFVNDGATGVIDWLKVGFKARRLIEKMRKFVYEMVFSRASKRSGLNDLLEPQSLCELWKLVNTFENLERRVASCSTSMSPMSAKDVMRCSEYCLRSSPMFVWSTVMEDRINLYRGYHIL